MKNIFTVKRNNEDVEIISQKDKDLEDLYTQTFLDIILNLDLNLSDKKYEILIEPFCLKISQDIFSQEPDIAFSFLKESSLTKKDKKSLAARDPLCQLSFAIKKELFKFRNSLKTKGLTQTLEEMNNFYAILLYWHKNLPESYIYSFVDNYQAIKNI